MVPSRRTKKCLHGPGPLGDHANIFGGPGQKDRVGPGPLGRPFLRRLDLRPDLRNKGRPGDLVRPGPFDQMLRRLKILVQLYPVFMYRYYNVLNLVLPESIYSIYHSLLGTTVRPYYILTGMTPVIQ
eukprot:SAG11_NODE_43_length_20795_cov_11.860456_15_plen_127_part_00